MTDEELTRLEGLCEAAEHPLSDVEELNADARLGFAAREALPALIAEVRGLRRYQDVLTKRWDKASEDAYAAEDKAMRYREALAKIVNKYGGGASFTAMEALQEGGTNA